MTITELANALQLEAVNVGDETAEVSGCFIGDMLSVVMSKAEEGNIWLTVQGNVNIDAVAALTGTAAIVIVEGMSPEQDAIAKAKAQSINLYKSEESAYALACRIGQLI